MTSKIDIKHKEIYDKVKLISNPLRFKILEITYDKSVSISELSSKLQLSYTKTSDYVKLLEKKDMIIKIKQGKNILIRSKVRISNNQMTF